MRRSTVSDMITSPEDYHDAAKRLYDEARYLFDVDLP